MSVMCKRSKSISWLEAMNIEFFLIFLCVYEFICRFQNRMYICNVPYSAPPIRTAEIDLPLLLTLLTPLIPLVSQLFRIQNYWSLVFQPGSIYLMRQYASMDELLDCCYAVNGTCLKHNHSALYSQRPCIQFFCTLSDIIHLHFCLSNQVIYPSNRIYPTVPVSLVMYASGLPTQCDVEMLVPNQTPYHIYNKF